MTPTQKKNIVEIVSIHAPRVGRDYPRIAVHPRIAGFNPRAPRGARPSYYF